jgi:gas vesicle protein
MMRLLKFLTGFAVGVMVGSALITLIVPQSGTETRQRFCARLRRIIEDAHRAAEATRTEAYIRLAELKTGGPE